jgi:hypothetical protein
MTMWIKTYHSNGPCIDKLLLRPRCCVVGLAVGSLIDSIWHANDHWCVGGSDPKRRYASMRGAGTASINRTRK